MLSFHIALSHFRSDAQRAAKQKEAKERELEHAAFSADRIEEGGFPPISMVSFLFFFFFALPSSSHRAQKMCCGS